MFQQIIFAGRLGKEPIMRFLPDGKEVTSFSVATSRKYKDVEEVVWLDVSVFGNQAESCNQYLSKGDPVLVVGRLKPDESGNPRTFQRKNGEAGASYEVTAQTVKFLPSGGKNDEVVF